MCFLSACNIARCVCCVCVCVSFKNTFTKVGPVRSDGVYHWILVALPCLAHGRCYCRCYCYHRGRVQCLVAIICATCRQRAHLSKQPEQDGKGPSERIQDNIGTRGQYDKANVTKSGGAKLGDKITTYCNNVKWGAIAPHLSFSQRKLKD